MKTLQKVALAIALISLFVSCQSNTNRVNCLSNMETRKQIIDSIANNREMMEEMMEAMVNNEHSKVMLQENEKISMIMMENQSTMMKMMEKSPDLMQGMLSDMMELCKSDPNMMSFMCRTMMGNQEMMDMIQKMKSEKKDMNKTGGMNHNKQH